MIAHNLIFGFSSGISGQSEDGPAKDPVIRSARQLKAFHAGALKPSPQA
jgi:hypothetical protein